MASPGCGPAADPTGAYLANTFTRYAAPAAVLEAPPEDLWAIPKVASNYADAAYAYPVATPAAAWASAACYHDSGETDPELGGRIKAACDYHRLGGEWERLRARAAGFHKAADVKRTALPGRYPLDTADQVRAAEGYFTRHAARFNQGDREAFAEALVKAADDLGVALGAREALETEAGRAKLAATATGPVLVRAALARAAGEVELAEALEKAAADLRPAGTFRSANELAGLLRKLDQDMGWDLPDPAAAMVETTPTGAKRALAEVVRAASGNWYKKADVAALPDDLARAYLGAGPVVGLSTKLAALADPGRGATAEQLLRDQGVVPVDRDPHTRVDWAALARGA